MRVMWRAVAGEARVLRARRGCGAAREARRGRAGAGRALGGRAQAGLLALPAAARRALLGQEVEAVTSRSPTTPAVLTRSFSSSVAFVSES